MCDDVGHAICLRPHISLYGMIHLPLQPWLSVRSRTKVQGSETETHHTTNPDVGSAAIRTPPTPLDVRTDHSPPMEPMATRGNNLYRSGERLLPY